MSDTQMEDILAELRGRREMYPPDRYPVQHATASFHLGVALIQAGQPEPAERVLEDAVKLFDRDGLTSEHAKSLNMLGVAHRDAGSLEEAKGCFAAAVQMFAGEGEKLERAAALYNLGLVHRELGDASRSVEDLKESLRIFEQEEARPASSAASRELGASLLASGGPDDAIPLLERAREEARSTGDDPSFGDASNALGLAYLAVGRTDDAIGAFKEAASADPPSVRPAAHAMAKANLATALERKGAFDRARMAALQARAIEVAPGPVRQQVGEILDRVGSSPGSLWRVLDNEGDDEATVRDELLRWARLEEAERRGELSVWIHSQSASETRGEDRAELWLKVLLELPPGPMETLVASAVAAAETLDEAAASKWASQTGRAMTRFHIPQWERIRSTFDRCAEKTGSALRWT